MCEEQLYSAWEVYEEEKQGNWLAAAPCVWPGRELQEVCHGGP